MVNGLAVKELDMDKPTMRPGRLYAMAVVFETFLTTSPQARCQSRNQPGILLNGTDVAGETTKLSIGQVITLTGEPMNGDGGIGWEDLGQDGGNPLADFSFPGCEPKKTPKCSSQLTYVDFSTNPLTLFWYYPGTYKVGYVYETEGGQEKSLVATFKVAGPNSTAISGVEGSIDQFTKTDKSGTHQRMGLGQTDVSPGISFTLSKSAYKAAGSVEWLQVAGSNTTVYYGSNPYTLPSYNGVDTLDKKSPFYSSGIKTDDSPDVYLCDKASEVDSTEVFAMYLMWKSLEPNSIFVPIGHVSWSWGATAYSYGNGDWSVYPSQGQPTATLVANVNYPIDDFPFWNTVARGITYSEACPNG